MGRRKAERVSEELGVSSTKGPGKNNYPFLDADPSRLAALLVGHISGYYSLLAPCHTGASTPKNGHLFLPGP